MKKIEINSILKCINLIFPFFYLVVGCLFLFNIFPNFNRRMTLTLGIIIILYGIFRFYMAYIKTRDTRYED